MNSRFKDESERGSRLKDNYERVKKRLEEEYTYFSRDLTTNSPIEIYKLWLY